MKDKIIELLQPEIDQATAIDNQYKQELEERDSLTELNDKLINTDNSADKVNFILEILNNNYPGIISDEEKNDMKAYEIYLDLFNSGISDMALTIEQQQEVDNLFNKYIELIKDNLDKIKKLILEHEEMIKVGNKHNSIKTKIIRDEGVDLDDFKVVTSIFDRHDELSALEKLDMITFVGANAIKYNEA